MGVAMALEAFARLRGIAAARVFTVLAVVFVLTVGVVAVLIVIDQQKVIRATRHLQEETVPEIIRYQRLARNLEQLRQEGERVFSSVSPPARQQAMFVVTLVASHPSVLEHPASAALARETEGFLNDVMRRASRDPQIFEKYREEWLRLSGRISVQVDDVSIQGINLANEDLAEVGGSMELARYRLFGALGLGALFLLLILVVLRRHLILPLQRIDHVLCNLSVEQPVPVFKPAVMREIQAVEEAIRELHESLVRNEQARFALEELANNDGLTGLSNRRHFMVMGNAEVVRDQRYGRPVSVGMADIDFFKRLNDAHGHAAGDAVLRALAGLMRDAFRQSDMICRYGGEEFAFLFPETTLDEAQVMAERLRSRCAGHAFLLPDGRQVPVTMSIGLANVGEHSLEAALNRADDALYEAKRQGRNRIVLAPRGEQMVLSEEF